MVVPSPTAAERRVTDKKRLRAQLKQRRREFFAAIPEAQRGLLFRRPPAAVAALVPEGAVVSVYHEMNSEVPASNYARWFFEAGHRVALPWFEERGAPMQFREWANPFVEELLIPDPYSAMQPAADAQALVPEVMFCPLLGFTAAGGRIGYGAGHYDKWMAGHRPALAIGLAWDCQLVDELPLEPHDVMLSAIVTPTRIYGSL
jgi:5-formyltetrahydrofolate cyclo-ligase